MRTAVVGVSLVVASCVEGASAFDVLDVVDMDAFATSVEPVLEHRCASAGCHGRPERPLALFAPGMMRAEPERLFFFEVLDPAELRANAARIAAFGVGSNTDVSLVLRKPLPRSAGGTTHGGGAIFLDATDVEFATLRAWLAAQPSREGVAP